MNPIWIATDLKAKGKVQSVYQTIKPLQFLSFTHANMHSCNHTFVMIIRTTSHQSQIVSNELAFIRICDRNRKIL